VIEIDLEWLQKAKNRTLETQNRNNGVLETPMPLLFL